MDKRALRWLDRDNSETEREQGFPRRQMQGKAIRNARLVAEHWLMAKRPGLGDLTSLTLGTEAA